MTRSISLPLTDAPEKPMISGNNQAITVSHGSATSSQVSLIDHSPNGSMCPFHV